MSRIPALDPATATGKTSELFTAVKSKLGMVPNLMRTLGQSPAAFLAKVKDTQRNTPIARVYHLLSALSDHRAAPTDTTRAAVEAELRRGDELLTKVSTGTDPEYPAYAVSHLVELNWWETRVRAELKAK